MGLMDRLALSLLYALPPETAHHAALYALEHHLVWSRVEPDDAVLQTRVWDLDFRNPVGLAAGFDKDARVADAMLSLGFGFVECVSVGRRRRFNRLTFSSPVDAAWFSTQSVRIH